MMTVREALQTRIIVARLFEVPPDDVDHYSIDPETDDECHFFKVIYRGERVVWGSSNFLPIEELCIDIKEMRESMDLDSQKEN